MIEGYTLQPQGIHTQSWWMTIICSSPFKFPIVLARHIFLTARSYHIIINTCQVTNSLDKHICTLFKKFLPVTCNVAFFLLKMTFRCYLQKRLSGHASNAVLVLMMHSLPCVSCAISTLPMSVQRRDLATFSSVCGATEFFSHSFWCLNMLVSTLTCVFWTHAVCLLNSTLQALLQIGYLESLHLLLHSYYFFFFNNT